MICGYSVNYYATHDYYKIEDCDWLINYYCQYHHPKYTALAHSFQLACIK